MYSLFSHQHTGRLPKITFPIKDVSIHTTDDDETTPIIIIDLGAASTRRGRMKRAILFSLDLSHSSVSFLRYTDCSVAVSTFRPIYYSRPFCLQRFIHVS